MLRRIGLVVAFSLVLIAMSDPAASTPGWSLLTGAHPGVTDLNGLDLIGEQSALVGSPGYGSLPLLFIPNWGQMDQQVAYYVQGRDKTLYFSSEGITILFTEAEPESSPSAGSALTRRTTANSVQHRREKSMGFILIFLFRNRICCS